MSESDVNTGQSASDDLLPVGAAAGSSTPAIEIHDLTVAYRTHPVLWDIDLRLPAEFSAVLALAVDEGGKIEAENFPFTTELVESDRLDLLVGDGDGLISGAVRGKGNIYVHAGE